MFTTRGLTPPAVATKRWSRQAATRRRRALPRAAGRPPLTRPMRAGCMRPRPPRPQRRAPIFMCRRKVKCYPKHMSRTRWLQPTASWLSPKALLSAPNRASGCTTLRPASANRLGRGAIAGHSGLVFGRPTISGLFSAGHIGRVFDRGEHRGHRQYARHPTAAGLLPLAPATPLPLLLLVLLLRSAW